MGSVGLENRAPDFKSSPLFTNLKTPVLALRKRVEEEQKGLSILVYYTLCGLDLSFLGKFNITASEAGTGYVPFLPGTGLWHH
jgi:hypothetical protein